MRKLAGPPGRNAPRQVYLCHDFCELGAVLFSDVVAELRSFLEEHPGEVLVIVVQDELPAEDLLPVTGPLTLAEVRRQVVALHAGTRLEQVLDSCSVLVGDAPAGSRPDADVHIEPGSSVEFLPPFAGG